MFFQLVSILFAIVPDYGNEYTKKENKNWTSFKNFVPKLNLNHNMYINLLYICYKFIYNYICKFIVYIKQQLYPHLTLSLPWVPIGTYGFYSG